MVPLIDCAWRATVVLTAAGLAGLLLRHAAASVRHVVWACALAGVLAVPLVPRVLPRWTVPVGRGLVEAPQAALLSVEARLAGTSSAQAAGHPHSPKAPATAPTRALPLSLAYLAGSLAVLLYMAAGWVCLFRLRRSAQPARTTTRAVAAELGREMGIGAMVRVLETRRAAIPVTWGVFRPVIVVPAAVANDGGQLRVVLMHELAHIARRDYLSHVLGQLACAVYWFHPLAWVAQRQALRLRERAADDLVLGHGVRASEYAGHLVGLARSLSAPRMCGSLAMAHRSYLEQRVRAILDGGVRRAALGRGALAAAVVCAAVVVAGVTSVGVAAQEENPHRAVQSREEAAQLTSRMAEAVKARYGAQSLEYAQLLLRLGCDYLESDHLAEAVAAYTPAIAILEAKSGKDSPELVAPFYALGLAAHVKKDYALAAQYYQRAADIGAAKRPNSRQAARARLGLVQLACQSGDYTKAAGLIQQARAASPGDSLEMAALLDTSAQILRNLGSEIDAQTAVDEATAMRRLDALRPPPPNAAADGVVGAVYRVGGGVLPPKLGPKVEPEYSEEARALKVSGTVTLSVIVGTDGLTHDVKVIRPIGFGLDQKAVEAIQQWHFTPGTKDGAPVNVAATIEVNFRLM